MNWNAIKFSALNRANYMICSWAAVALGLVFAVGWAAHHAVAFGLVTGALFAGLAAVLFGSSYVQYIRGLETNQRAALETWVADAMTEQEREARWAQCQQLDGAGFAEVDSFISQQNVDFLHPVVNTDGTPMLLGGAIDMHGNTFGMNELSVAAVNDATGTWSTPGAAYESPIGM